MGLCPDQVSVIALTVCFCCGDSCSKKKVYQRLLLTQPQKSFFHSYILTFSSHLFLQDSFYFLLIFSMQSLLIDGLTAVSVSLSASSRNAESLVISTAVHSLGGPRANCFLKVQSNYYHTSYLLFVRIKLLSSTSKYVLGTHILKYFQLLVPKFQKKSKPALRIQLSYCQKY